MFFVQSFAQIDYKYGFILVNYMRKNLILIIVLLLSSWLKSLKIEHFVKSVVH